MKNKPFLTYFVLALFAILVLAGCSGGSEQTSENDNLDNSSNTNDSSNSGDGEVTADSFTYWYPWGGDSEKWDKWRMEKYEEDSGVSIDALYAPPDGGLSNGKLLSAISGGNPPDLVISNDYALAYGLAAQGALEPIDEYLANAGFAEGQVLEGFVPLMKQEDGKTYLLPQDSNVNLLYYNVEMFEAAGLDPNNPPSTIEELDEAAEALTKIENDKIETLGFIPWLDAGDGSYLWGWVFGASFFDPAAKEVKLNEQPLIEAYKWMDSYAQKYNPEKIKSFTSGFGGAFSPDHPFFTGKVAMTVNGNWFANALKLYSPDTEYRVAPIPAPPGGREKATTLGSNVWMVPKGAENPQAAIDFALYGSKQDILADNINTWRSISIWKETTDAIELDGDHVYDTVLEVAASPNAGHPALTSIAGQMADELLALRDSVIYNDNDLAELLKKAEKKMQKEIDKN